MADSSSSQLHDLANCLSDWRLTSSIAVASSALLFYDYTLTWSEEVRFLWVPERPNFGRILFFLARYPALAGAIIDILPATVTLGNVLTCIRLITIIAADFVFATRTWAIWQRDRRIMIFLICVSIAAIVPAVVIIEKDIVTTVWGPSVAPDLTNSSQCQILVSAVKNVWVVPYVIVICYEFITLTLSMYKILAYFREAPIATRSPLMHVLWTDGIMYFVFMLLLGVFNIVLVLQVSAPQLRSGGTQLQMILHSVLSTRAVLHLSSTSSRTLNGANTGSGSITDYKFTTMIFPEHYTPDTVHSGGTGTSGTTSASGGAYSMTMTMTVTDESAGRAAGPVSVGSHDIEMGVMRTDAREGGGGRSGEGVVLEVPRSPLSPSLPRSPTLVDVYVGDGDKP